MADHPSPLPPACVPQVGVFSGLTPAEQGRVAEFARPVTLAAGERLYGVGDEVSQLFVVHTGSVRVVRVTAPGHEQLIRIAGPTEVVGEYPFLTGRPPLAWVFAVEPTRLCVFDHRDLAPLLTGYPDIAVKLLASLAERLGHAEGRFASLAGVDVTRRVVGYLLSLSSHHQVRLPMSKRNVASYLGTTPETLSRALRRLQEQGLIRVGEHGVVTLLDRRGLETLLQT